MKKRRNPPFNHMVNEFDTQWKLLVRIAQENAEEKNGD